jgi:hypothetical protein
MNQKIMEQIQIPMKNNLKNIKSNMKKLWVKSIVNR